MTLYCSQCGAAFEDGAEFCYQCGALKCAALDIDDDGTLRPVDESATRVCPSCGHENPFNDAVCGSCGAAMPSIEGSLPPRRLGRRGFAALGVGLVGGVVGVCGLGHLLMGRISRGLMYIGMSSVVLYLQICLGFDSAGPQAMLLRILGFAVFAHSSLDLFRVVYAPGSKGGERWPTTGPRSTAPRTCPRCSAIPEPARR